MSRGTKEWTGAWSDTSREWASLTADEREKLKLHVADDGEFWMTYGFMRVGGFAED